MCRRPAIDDLTGRATDWMGQPSFASVDGLSSTAALGQDGFLCGAATVGFQQVLHKPLSSLLQGWTVNQRQSSLHSRPE